VEVTYEPLDEDQPPETSGRRAGPGIPVINQLGASEYPQEFTDLDYPVAVADEFVRCPGVRDTQAFAARILGDSMEPDFAHGDIVVFAPNTPAENGNDCFVRFVTGGTTFKRVYLDGPHSVRLQPLNPAYPPRTYARDEINGIWPAIVRIQKLR
jgi:phage repressor protein C with HTH and peptisase S24 domain